MTRTAGITAGAATAIAGIAYLLATQSITPGPSSAAGHVAIDAWDGGDANTVCVWASARVDPPGMALFGFDAGGASYVYARAVVCSDPVDGGLDPGPGFLPGIEIVYDDSTAAPWVGGHQLEAWTDTWRDVDGGYPAWPCACALPVDAGSCMVTRPIIDDGGTQTVSAPTGITLPAGAWSGSSCRPKTCVELSGYTSWPPECG